MARIHADGSSTPIGPTAVVSRDLARQEVPRCKPHRRRLSFNFSQLISRSKTSGGEQAVFDRKSMKPFHVSHRAGAFLRQIINGSFSQPGDKDLIQSLVLDAKLTDIPSDKCNTSPNYRE